MISATEIFCLNELGQRSNNEDHISPAKGTATLSDRLFIVCDGVGGEKKGEVASEIVCRSIQEHMRKQAILDGREAEAIQKGIHYANQNLLNYASKDSDAKRMSTTVALVFLGELSVVAAWCGDTRIHHIRNGEILWKSKDHSLVGELVSQGELTEEEAKKHPQRNIITRSLNALNYSNIVEFHEIKNFETGDYLLLCTDGFLERVDERVIRDILTNSETDKAKLFFSHCNQLTRDNFSMYLIRGQHDHKRKQSSTKRSMILLIVMLLLSIVLILYLIRDVTFR